MIRISKVYKILTRKRKYTNTRQYNQALHTPRGYTGKKRIFFLQQAIRQLIFFLQPASSNRTTDANRTTDVTLLQHADRPPYHSPVKSPPINVYQKKELKGDSHYIWSNFSTICFSDTPALTISGTCSLIFNLVTIATTKSTGSVHQKRKVSWV